jgi:hypothetical protein
VRGSSPKSTRAIVCAVRRQRGSFADWKARTKSARRRVLHGLSRRDTVAHPHQSSPAFWRNLLPQTKFFVVNQIVIDVLARRSISVSICFRLFLPLFRSQAFSTD